MIDDGVLGVKMRQQAKVRQRKQQGKPSAEGKQLQASLHSLRAIDFMHFIVSAIFIQPLQTMLAHECVCQLVQSEAARRLSTMQANLNL